MTRARVLADLGNSGTFSANADTNRVGISSANPTATLDVTGDVNVSSAATFGGNVTVGGTLTYEDATNVDSVGLVTAQSGVDVSGGQLLVGLAYSVGNAGVATAAGFVGPLTGNVSGGTVAGTTGTFSSDVDIADKIIHTGDTNTAIRFPAADTFTVETGGSERFRVTSGGDVGIGTATPTNIANFTSFTLDGTTGGNIEFKDNGVLRGSVYNLTDQFIVQAQGSSTPLAFRTNSIERLRITSSGRLGIGTESPSNFLHVKNYTSSSNYIIAENTTTGNAGVRLKNSQGDYAIFANEELIFYDLGNDVQRLGITSSGNVNIGGNYEETSHQLNISHSTKPSLCLHTGTTQRADFSATTGITSIRSFSNSPFTINIGGAGETEAFRINGSGEVSVGTATGGKTLTLYGASSSSFRISKSGVVAYDHTFDGSSYTIANNNGSAGIPIIIGTKTSGGESVRITAAGHMGLGTTNPTSDGGTTFEIYNATTPTLKLNDGGEYKALFQLRGNDLEIRGSSGAMEFYTGNADGASSTEKLSITSVGQIQHQASSGDNQFVSKRTDAAGSNGSYFFHLRARNNSPVDVGSLGFHRDTATDDSRFVISTRNNGGSNTEKLRIDSVGRVMVGITTVLTQGSGQYGKLVVAGNTLGAGGDGRIILARGLNVGQLSNGNELGGVYFTDNQGNDFAAIRATVDNTPGSDDFPGRIAFYTVANNTDSLGERARISNDGYFKASNDGNYQSEVSYHEFGQTKNEQGMIGVCTHPSFTENMFIGRTVKAGSSTFNFVNLQTAFGSSLDSEFILRGDGTGYADGSWLGGGADYAEYFEWLDGNANNDDRRGIAVVLDGEKIREAVEGEDPIGVISGNPSVVGDTAWNHWKGKNLRDDFGTYIQEDYEVQGDDGNPVTQQRRKVNPDFDPDAKYVPREDRPEWDCVGLMGKLRIRKGQVTGSRWIKMRDVSDSVEEWLVR